MERDSIERGRDVGQEQALGVDVDAIKNYIDSVNRASRKLRKKPKRTKNWERKSRTFGKY